MAVKEEFGFLFVHITFLEKRPTFHQGLLPCPTSCISGKKNTNKKDA